MKILYYLAGRLKSLNLKIEEQGKYLDRNKTGQSNQSRTITRKDLKPFVSKDTPLPSFMRNLNH
jgi:hypothetical protein